MASLGSLTGFEDSPSLNDAGLVAFVGKFGSVLDLLVGDNSNPVKNLSTAFSGRFTRAVQINNNNQIVAHDRLGGFSSLRVWDADEPGRYRVYGTGIFPPDNVNFENIFSFPSINNHDQAVFTATPIGAFPRIALETLVGASPYTNFESFSALPSSIRSRVSSLMAVVADWDIVRQLAQLQKFLIVHGWARKTVSAGLVVRLRGRSNCN